MTNKDNWTPWKRDSHFRLTEPSITIYKDGITFNASLNKIVDVSKFMNVMVELNDPDNEKATKVRCVLNNLEESDSNFKITRSRNSEDHRRGFVSCRNLIQFQPRLKKISDNKRSARRIEVKQFGRDANSFVFNLIPCFELASTDTAGLPTEAGIYRYMDKAEVVYIGRGKSIKSRSKDLQRSNWVFDKIEYSLISDEKDQVFWESKFLEDFKLKFGRLPRYNEQAGATIHQLN